MRILLDHAAPKGLRRKLTGHSVVTAKAAGWERLTNGELLRAAEEAGFDVLLTADQGIHYQQNFAGRKIALVVLTGSSKWSRVQICVEAIAAGVDAAAPGSYAEIFIPFEPKPKLHRS